MKNSFKKEFKQIIIKQLKFKIIYISKPKFLNFRITVNSQKNISSKNIIDYIFTTKILPPNKIPLFFKY